MSYSIDLPNGQDFLVRVNYTQREVSGVTVLVIVSSISIAAVCGLLAAISLSAFNTRKSTDNEMFVRTHVAAYFVSLLLCDLLQAIGSIMNTKWIQHNAVYIGQFCTIQGAVKQASDVGTALFSLILAIHTFFILFLQWQTKTYVLWLTLVSAWSFMGAILLVGPATLDSTTRGPFLGISGYWCWITDGYSTQHITLDYMFMFMSALLSFILYSLVFLRLRGNIVVSGWHIVVTRGKPQNGPQRGRDFADNQMMSIARHMLLYPVAYTIIILPIAVARFSSFAGHDVPFGVTIFADTVFLLSGTVNVVLFSTTRRVLPPRSIIPGQFVISKPKAIEESVMEDPEAYYRGGSTEKLPETPTAVFKRAESYTSDSRWDLSLPNEHNEMPTQPPDFEQVQLPVALHPNQSHFSGESTYDLYSAFAYRASDTPRITEEEYHRPSQMFF